MELKLDNLNKLLFDKLDELIADGILYEKKIVLFGLNSTSFCIKKYLEKHGFKIYAYLDNDINKVEETKRVKNMMMKNLLPDDIYNSIHSETINVMKPEEITSLENKKIVVLIASKYYQDMKRQLEDYGYQEGIHFFQIIDFYMINQMVEHENNSGNNCLMKPEELKRTQLEILFKLKEVCDNNHLRYYICGGTLLGAVRHKGYIPWDDDIDVAMPLMDYKKLMNILYNDKKYDLLSSYQKPDSVYFFFMKMVDKDTVLKAWEYPFLLTSSVGIDIFPLFGLPNGSENIMQYYHQIRYLNTEFINTFLEDYMDKDVLVYRNELRKKIIEMMEKYPFDESEKIGYLLSKYKEKEIMPRSIYESSVELEFEGMMLSAASGYQEYLTILFRDYMKLPPLEQRYNTHNYLAYRNN